MSHSVLRQRLLNRSLWLRLDATVKKSFSVADKQFLLDTLDGPENFFNLIFLFRAHVNNLGRSYLNSNLRNKQIGLKFKGQLISKAIYGLLTSPKKQI